MRDSDIQKALYISPEVSLDRLEDDIWKAVDVRMRTSRTAAVAAAWQAAAVALAFISSVAGGSFAAHSPAAGASRLHVFSPDLALAPSSLLLGDKL